MRPCPDHDGERVNLLTQRKTVFHRKTWPVVGPGYDRRKPLPETVIPLMSREDRETKRVEKMLKDKGYQRITIGGYTLTYHAIARMIVRQIKRQWVEDAMTRPRFTSQRLTGAGKHVGPNAMCVVNHATREIVTIGYGLDYHEPAA
jgi:hypothetical protein